MQWIGFPRGSVSVRHSNVRKSLRWVTLFDSPAYGAEWVLISALGLNGSTKCHICHVSHPGVWCFVGWKHHGMVGSPLSAVCVCLCVCVCGGGCLHCYVGWALFETRPRGPELKPYLRGFRTDGVPLFEDVFIIRKWGWIMNTPPLIIPFSQ